MKGRRRWTVLAVLALATLAACSSSSTVTCSFDDPAFLCGSAPGEASCPQQSAWPKFHHDIQNTGSVANAMVTSNPGQLRWVFPSGGQHKGAFTASPVINTAGTIVYIGSADGTFYAINVANGSQNTAFNFAATQAITSTALVATRDAMDAVFVSATDGHVYGLNQTAAGLQTNWPSVPGGFLSAPSMTLDGSVYANSADGLFVGVCPNGIERFIISVPSNSLSSPAQAPDGTFFFGGDDRQLRSVQFNSGTVNWTFSAAGPIDASPVYDVETNSIYVADRAGQVFKVDTSGRPDGNFNQFAAVGPISSSPALAGAHLYFGSDDGNVYALRKDTGHIDWSFSTGDIVFSSPAVATGGPNPIVVVGSNNGNVYFLEDTGDNPPPELVPAFNVAAMSDCAVCAQSQNDGAVCHGNDTECVALPTGAGPICDISACAVHSSPAIGSDGTVYIGADDGRVYAIGSALPPPPTPSPTP